MTPLIVSPPAVIKKLKEDKMKKNQKICICKKVLKLESFSLSGKNLPFFSTLTINIEDGKDVPCSFFETTKILYNAPFINDFNVAEVSVTFTC